MSLPVNAQPTEVAALGDTLRRRSLHVEIPGALAEGMASRRVFFNAPAYLREVASFRRTPGGGGTTEVELLLNGESVLAAPIQHDAGGPLTAAGNLATDHARSVSGAIQLQAGDHLDVEVTAVEDPVGAAVTGGAETFELEAGQTLVVEVDGEESTATFDATAGYRQIFMNGPFVLEDGQTLTVNFAGAGLETFTFHTADFVDIGAATALEVQAVIDATIVNGATSFNGPRLRLSSLKKGTGATVSALGGTAVALTGGATGAAGGGDVADITAVTHAEVKAVVENDIAGVTVSQDGDGNTVITADTADTLQVTGGTARVALGFDDDLHSASAAADLDVQLEIAEG